MKESEDIKDEINKQKKKRRILLIIILLLILLFFISPIGSYAYVHLFHSNIIYNWIIYDY